MEKAGTEPEKWLNGRVSEEAANDLTQGNGPHVDEHLPVVVEVFANFLMKNCLKQTRGDLKYWPYNEEVLDARFGEERPEGLRLLAGWQASFEKLVAENSRFYPLAHLVSFTYYPG